jgi:hypothetical protein
MQYDMIDSLTAHRGMIILSASYFIGGMLPPGTHNGGCYPLGSVHEIGHILGMLYSGEGSRQPSKHDAMMAPLWRLKWLLA